MHRTFIGDRQQSLPLLVRELTDELNLDLDRIDQTILAGTFSGVIRAHLGMRQVDENTLERPTSLMGLVGAAVTFRLLGRLQGELAIALKEGLATVDREIELTLHPPRSYQYVSYFAYLTGIFGTAIWGYGDQLLRLAAGPHWGKGD